MTGRVRAAACVVLALVSGCQAYDRLGYRLLSDSGRMDSASDATMPTPDTSSPDESLALDASDASTALDARDAMVTPDASDAGDTMIASDATDAGITHEQVINGSFEIAQADAGVVPWYLHLAGSAMATVAQDAQNSTDGTHAARIDVTAVDGTDYHAQLGQAHLSLVSGQQYALHFAVTARLAGIVRMVVQAQVSPYTTYYQQTVAVDPTTREYDFTAMALVSDDVMITFNVGTSVNTVWLDDVRLGS